MQSDGTFTEKRYGSIDHKSYPAYKIPAGKLPGLQTMCYPSIMCREILLRRPSPCAHHVRGCKRQRHFRNMP